MWAKFGQMTGKVISKIKRPKSIKAKAMSMAQNAKSKVKGYGSKAKEAAKKIYEKNPVFNKSDVSFIKENPGISAGAAGVGLVAGYGINKMRKKNKKKEYKTTDLDLGKYSYKITSYK